MNSLTTCDTSFLGTLPPDVRDEVCAWRDALRTVTKPIQKSLERIAAQIGVSYKTARRNYDAWTKGATKANQYFPPGDLRVLVNYSRVPASVSALSPEFLEWFKALAENNQRKTKPAYRKFCSLWKSGAQIPGMDNSLPRHSLPPGFSSDNIYKKTRAEFEKLVMRRGLGFAVGKCGPQIFGSRANLWYGSHYMIDDMWHDNFVVFGNGKNAQLVRVLELDAMDLFSGYQPAWGTKARFKREDGKMDNLKEKYARVLVANLMFNEGYSPRGTNFLAELGTAAISERIEKILHDYSHGVIRVDRNGITGEQQVLCGHRGDGKGNPRFKAALESIRNLKHNELGALPAQTGKDRDHRPEFTHGQLQDCADLLKAMVVLATKSPSRAAQLRLNLMDYHADFLPLLMDVYRELNWRTWHDLQGWHEIPGNMVIEYRLAPSADHWLTDSEFSALPEVSKQLLLSAAVADRRYINKRKLSPAEVRNRSLQTAPMLKLPPFVVCDMLGEDFAFELKVRGAYFHEFADQEIAPEPIRFESVILTPDGQRQQLSDGTYLVFLNPFAANQLFVCDARQRCLGIAPRVERVDRTDLEQLKRAYGNRERRLAELKAPMLERHAATVREETKRLEHNARALDLKKPFTPGEIAEAEFVKEHGSAAAEAILAKPEGIPHEGDDENEDAQPNVGDDLLDAIK